MLKVKAKTVVVEVPYRIGFQPSKRDSAINRWDHRVTKTLTRMVCEDQRTILQLLGMDMEFNIGPMVPITKDSGHTTKQRVKALSGMLRVMSIEVNSRMIWPMGMVNTHISMVQSTKENSEMMSRRVMVRRNGSTEQNMSVHTKME